MIVGFLHTRLNVSGELGTPSPGLVEAVEEGAACGMIRPSKSHEYYRDAKGVPGVSIIGQLGIPSTGQSADGPEYNHHIMG